MRFIYIIGILCFCFLQGCGLILDKFSKEEPKAEEETMAWPIEPFPYIVTITVSNDNPHLSQISLDELKAQMQGLSELERLQGSPPDGALGLERRVRLDMDTARQLLQAKGFYDGKVESEIDTKQSPAKVKLRLIPNYRYHIAKTSVHYQPEPIIPENIRHAKVSNTYTTLADLIAIFDKPVGRALPEPRFVEQIPSLKAGDIAATEPILDAVEKLPQVLHRQGYPFAEIKKTRYLLNRRDRTLSVEVEIDPGPPALIGEIIIQGNKEVDADYLQRLKPWHTDFERWNENRVERYAEQLRTLGLFRQVEIKPAWTSEQLQAAYQNNPNPEEALGLPVIVEVREARAMRSIGAELRYETDTGFGVTGEWEHRNLLGNGEKLTLTAPVSLNKTGLIARFEKPAVGTRHTKWIVEGQGLREINDAYEREGFSGSNYLQHQINRNWWLSIGLAGETGMLKEDDRKRQPYGFGGPGITLRRDTRDYRVSSTQGMNIAFSFKPLYGYYDGFFSAYAKELDAAIHFSPLGRTGWGPERRAPLVLSGRVRIANIENALLRNLPSTLRYYAGGANSVRGYNYQDIGPKNSSGEPVGGMSSNIINLESRIAITKDLGIVPFVDAGMVYRKPYPHWFTDLNWGGGLGLRYFTPIGPLRLDVATPIRYDNYYLPLFFYISIGQFF